MNALLDARLAWRAASGRNAARVSLVVRIIGVAFAALVLLLASSADGALDSRGDRVTWRTNWNPTTAEVHPGNAWMQVGWENDYYLGHEISRVRVARYSDEAETPPGLPRFPEHGESFVSPALAKLIEADPEVLGGRYGDAIAGTISNEGLSHPGELVVITGVTPPEGEEFFGFGMLYQELPSGFHDNSITVFMWIVITIGIVVLLFPIAMFIASAARLNAQESDARLAAFRLAGASPARVRWMVAWESMISALPGALLGLAMFFAVRPLVAGIELGGTAFFPSDFSLNLISLLILLVIPLVVVAASFIGLRDVEISPLGVSRHSQRKAVRPIGFAFLVPGFLLLWYGLGSENPNSQFQQSAGLVLSIFLILVGVALIGTWLGQVAATILASKVRSGSALLALRRVGGDPHGSFRTVSGVTFAVFAGTLFLSLSAALEREVEVGNLSGLRDDVIWVSHNEPVSPALQGAPDGTAVVVLAEAGGVVGDPQVDGLYVRVYQGDCEDFARVLAITGGCDGRVSMHAGLGVAPGDVVDFWWEERGKPTASFTVPADFHTFDADGFGMWSADIILPPGTIAGFEDYAQRTTAIAPPAGISPGDREFEQLRTAVMRAYPWGTIYYAREHDQEAVSGLETMKDLVYAGTFAAFILSGGTAAMAVAGSIIARRQSFALLRMSGVSLAALRRTVMAEATMPLLLVSTVSAATAVCVSALMIQRVGQGSVLPPPEFILPLVGGLVVGLILPLMTLPLLGRVTAMERTRFD